MPCPQACRRLRAPTGRALTKAGRAPPGEPPTRGPAATGTAATPRGPARPAAYPFALAGVLVGVVLQRQLAVGALDLLGGGGGLHLQDVVVLRLLHHGVPRGRAAFIKPVTPTALLRPQPLTATRTPPPPPAQRPQ